MRALRLATLACTALAAGLPGGCANDGRQTTAPAHADTALAARIDALVEPLVAAHEFSGAIVLTQRGRVVYQRGFGLANRAAGAPFTPDTPSDGGSIAKTFTAAGVHWLVHEGKVDLDAPVARYVAGFPHAQTTVRQLLTHSNGLPPYYEFFDPWYERHPEMIRTTEGMLAIVARDAPAPSFAPGTRFEYSNLGYDAAALLIERVSGTPYAQFVRERFLAPLGMRSTFARPARLSDWTGVRTLGYRWHDGAWQVFDVFDREGFLGASNLYLSASDLSRWVAAHAAGSPPLPAAAFAAGQRRGEIAGRRTPLTELSWYCDDAVERCYYTGSLNAFHAFAWSDRARNESVAFVSNSTLPPWRVVSLQRALVDALAGRPADVNPAATFARSDRVTRRSLAGSWLAPGVDPVSLVPTSTGLRMRFGAGLEYDVFQVSREVFYVPGPDVWFAFSGSPPAVSMHLRGMFVDAVAQRAGQGAPRHVVVPAIADRR